MALHMCGGVLGHVVAWLTGEGGGCGGRGGLMGWRRAFAEDAEDRDQ